MHVAPDLPLNVLADLFPAWRKYLDPVVAIWIVRSADDDARIEIECSRQVSNPRRRNHPRRLADSIRLMRSRMKSSLDAQPRFTRIPPRQKPSLAPQPL